MKEELLACLGHEQLINKHGEPCFCEECGKPICKNCGLCFNQ